MPPPKVTDDPVIASYDIFITDAQIRRLLVQFPDRQFDQPYNESSQQKPLELRLKPKTGLIELDVPINTQFNYDESKGLRYGNAMRKSNIIQAGGTHGMAGGFNSGGGTGAGKVKSDVGDMDDGMGLYMDLEDEERKMGVTMTKQTLGGRIKKPIDGDPVYMLGSFRDNELHLSPLESVVQLRPQLHHIDAYDEVAVKGKAGVKGRKGEMEDDAGGRPTATEARAIDMRVKSAEAENSKHVGNNELMLKLFQDEKWEKYAWIDENDQESWDQFDQYMFNTSLDEPATLTSMIGADDYLDQMSAPRVDPTRPDMTGWAMKMRSKKRRSSSIRKRSTKAQLDVPADGNAEMGNV
ncbi:hypothetical protein FQN57_000776 [Myotisia sp. PD_48]|nr:hypothetical protein FQN57_000776 [Myotisia sp. PD_48]